MVTRKTDKSIKLGILTYVGSKFLYTIASLALSSLIVKIAWNTGASSIFGLSPLTYSQAFALTLVCDVLFKGGERMRPISSDNQ